jgi:hypothetical protein
MRICFQQILCGFSGALLTQENLEKLAFALSSCLTARAR